MTKSQKLIWILAPLVLWVVLLLTACSFNPYNQPGIVYDQQLVPIGERKATAVNYCSVYG